MRRKKQTRSEPIKWSGKPNKTWSGSKVNCLLKFPKALRQKYFESVLQSIFYWAKKLFVTSTILSPGLHENLRPWWSVCEILLLVAAH